MNPKVEESKKKYPKLWNWYSKYMVQGTAHEDPEVAMSELFGAVRTDFNKERVKEIKRGKKWI